MSPRKTGVENIDDDDDYAGKVLQRASTQDHLERNGSSQRLVGNRKSQEFLEKYDVLMPVTHERRKKNKNEWLPYLGSL